MCGCRRSTNGADAPPRGNRRFTTLPYHSPDIALGAPDSITQTSATVNATVDRKGEPLEECNIEFGTSEAYGSNVECTPTPGSGTGPEPVSGSLASLEPNTTYHYGVSTDFLGNAGHSADGTFTTQTYVPPTVLTGAASSITQTSATLNGRVNPNGEEVETCEIQFGPTTEYGSSAPCEPGALSGTAPIAVSVHDTGLTPGSTYHFRILATGLHRAVEGNDETFTTLPSARARANDHKALREEGRRGRRHAGHDHGNRLHRSHRGQVRRDRREKLHRGLSDLDHGRIACGDDRVGGGEREHPRRHERRHHER